MWTYSGDPATTELDEVRFYIQDVEESFPLLQDEDITFLIDRYLHVFGHLLAVAAMACEIIASKFAREVSASADGVSVNLSELQQRYNDLAQSLRDQFSAIAGSDLSGALDAMFADVSKFEIEPLMFGIGFMDNYRAGQQDYGYYAPGEIHWANPEGAAEASALQAMLETEPEPA